mmetsp:Transcript_14541/g.34528  ORF Transcript_14541/g.34528 Transcript_14541/m.34528 type:complete len:209 (+) Transcript_14541:415-1041(+)
MFGASKGGAPSQERLPDASVRDPIMEPSPERELELLPGRRAGDEVELPARGCLVHHGAHDRHGPLRGQPEAERQPDAAHPLRGHLGDEVRGLAPRDELLVRLEDVLGPPGDVAPVEPVSAGVLGPRPRGDVDIVILVAPLVKDTPEQEGGHRHADLPRVALDLKEQTDLIRWAIPDYFFHVTYVSPLEGIRHTPTRVLQLKLDLHARH